MLHDGPMAPKAREMSLSGRMLKFWRRPSLEASAEVQDANLCIAAAVCKVLGRTMHTLSSTSGGMKACNKTLAAVKAELQAKAAAAQEAKVMKNVEG